MVELYTCTESTIVCNTRLVMGNREGFLLANFLNTRWSINHGKMFSEARFNLKFEKEGETTEVISDSVSRFRLRFRKKR